MSLHGTHLTSCFNQRSCALLRVCHKTHDSTDMYAACASALPKAASSVQKRISLEEQCIFKKYSARLEWTEAFKLKVFESKQCIFKWQVYIYIYAYRSVLKGYSVEEITKASLLAGVCFPLGMYWGQSFWCRSDLSHRNVPFKWFNHLILTPPPPRRVQLPVGPWSSPVGPWSSELFWITVSLALHDRMEWKELWGTSGN